MKTSNIFKFGISLLVLVVNAGMSSLAYSGQVTYPDNSYSTGDTLTAGGLNTKFNEIKSAVNDNNSKTTLSNLVCTTGQVPKWSGSTWACQNDLTRAAGAVSVSPHAFSSENTSVAQVTACVLAKNEGTSYAYFLATGTNTNGACDANAGVQLPDGVTLTGFSCKVFDNAGQPSPGNHMSAALRRINISAAAAGTVQLVFSTGQSIDSTNEQILSDTTAATGTAFVDNSTYSYYISISYITNDFSEANGYGILQRFYGCSISYN